MTTSLSLWRTYGVKLAQALHLPSAGMCRFNDWERGTCEYSLHVYDSSRLLHSGDIIDQTYQTRRVLSLALARQWFGIHIVQKSWADAWLIYGLANLMGALFIKRHLGNSEFRLRMKRVCY